MPKFTQENRPFQLTTSLGEDVLLFRRMFGSEAVSRLFTYEIEALNERGVEFDINDLIGQSATVAMTTNSSPRYINGIVTKCAYIGEDKDFHRYRLTLQPKLWLLTLNASSRIFQQKSIPDILKIVFAAITVDFKLQRTYEPVNYCVQYRETDFNFVSRLMEQEGISYAFEHTNGQHTLVLTDTVGSPDPSCSIPYVDGAVDNDQNEIMSAWRATREIPLKSMTLWDAHFALPQKNLEAIKTATGANAQKLANGAVYDFPGGYATPFDPITPGGGEQAAQIQKIFTLNTIYAGIRLQEANSRFDEMTGVSNSPLLSAGGIFALTDHPVGRHNLSYLVLSTEYTIIGDDYRSDSAASKTVDVHITAIPATVQYRPPRVTPKPVVPGAQTAFVVGPSGQEIFVDKYGRVKVQFNWDREGTNDANSSCWLRVAQIWAGQGWGAMAIPRIGHEVIVDFLEGDPDQPIITGRVYNETNMPPYALPANMTVTTIKSNSSLGGGGSNEIKFEDKKDSEQVYVHAQKDFQRVVEHDESLDIKNDRTKLIREGNETITISKGNRSTTITEGNETITIGKGNRSTTISKGNETVGIDEGNRQVTIGKGDDALTISTGNRTKTISMGNETIAIDQGNRAATIGQGNDSLTVSVGDLTTTVSAGSCSITAGTKITLKVGPNSITIDQQGITLTGTMITVDGKADTQVKGGATLSMSSPATDLGGSASLTLSGGVVQIN
jgi:type VI secretion system secreted protein VgrG